MEDEDSITDDNTSQKIEFEDEQIEDNPFLGVNIEGRRSSLLLKSIDGDGERVDEIQVAASEGEFSIGQQEEDIEIKKLFNVDNINPTFRTLKYMAFGPMEERAAELEQILNDDDDYEFEQVLRANNDDAHAFGQKPLTFLRKVMAVVCYPRLLADNNFPDDVKSRARDVLQGCRGNSIGSVTDPAGIEAIRRHVAKYIENRDEVHSKWQDIILTAGSSEAIKAILKLIFCNENGKRSGVMLPTPTKQLYREYTQKQNLYPINYYLNEENNWNIEIDELNRAHTEALAQCNPRAIVVINPGNPTGQVLSRENIEDIIKFAYDKQLLICADEVHQFDIHIDEIQFISFKKVLKELGLPYKKMELVSFMSASAGYLGESGLRGGYMEFINVTPDVKQLFLKFISTKVCPPVLGQIAIEVLVNPPLPDEPSYEEYTNEKEDIMQLHRMQAGMVTVAFNQFKNFTCTPIMAGRHAFPSIQMPETAIQAAEDVNQAPDLYYTTQLLEQKGICVSPGSEFGQKQNTHHLSIALVLPTDDLNLMLGRFKQFNQRFNETFSCKCKRKKAPVD